MNQRVTVTENFALSEWNHLATDCLYALACIHSNLVLRILSMNFRQDAMLLASASHRVSIPRSQRK